MFLKEGLVPMWPEWMSKGLTYAGTIGTGVLLIILGIQDIRFKTIKLKSLLWILPFFCLDVIFHTELLVWERLLGVLIGICLLVVSKVSRGQVGMGDGYVLCTIGATIGFSRNLELLCYSMFIAALAAMVLLVIKHYNKKQTMPFIPFLFLGYLGCFIVNGGG